MKAARILLLAIPFALAALAQQTAEQAPKRPALPPDLQAIHDLALAAPPEFAADALLRIAASSKVTSRELKRELIERALQLAPSAQNAYERVSVPGTATDTRSGFLASALALRLDALSLQARAIVGLLGLDKPAAVAAMNALPHPDIAPLKCEDPLVPDLSGYYAALGAVVQQGLQGDTDQRTRFLLSAISKMTSVAEISPMARFLEQTKMGPEEAQIVYGTFLSKVDALPADPRSLTFYASHINTDLNSLMERASQLQGSEEFLEQLKTVVRRHQEAKRCREPGVVEIGGRPAGEEPDTPRLDTYWKTDAAKRMFEACALLRFRPNGSIINDAERATPEWARQLTDFLSLLQTWRPQDEASDADYYHQRAVVYEALVELTPAGPARDLLLRSYVGFITHSSLQTEAPVEWYWHARSLLDRMRVDPGAAAKVLNAYQESGSVILQLQAVLDRLDRASSSHATP